MDPRDRDIYYSLPGFMHFKLFGKTVLVVNVSQGWAFFGPSTQPVRLREYQESTQEGAAGRRRGETLEAEQEEPQSRGFFRSEFADHRSPSISGSELGQLRRTMDTYGFRVRLGIWLVRFKEVACGL